MARLTATNFSGVIQFPYATAAVDLFKKEDVQTLALAVDQHDHASGKGLAVTRAGALSFGTGSTPPTIQAINSSVNPAGQYTLQLASSVEALYLTSYNATAMMANAYSTGAGGWLKYANSVGSVLTQATQSGLAVYTENGAGPGITDRKSVV